MARTHSSLVVPSLLLTLVAACGTGSGQPGASSEKPSTDAAKVPTGTATLKNNAFGLDAGSVPPNAATVRVEVLSQSGCQSLGGWSAGQRNWRHRDGWLHQGIWGLRAVWMSMTSSFAYGGWSSPGGGFVGGGSFGGGAYGSGAYGYGGYGGGPGNSGVPVGGAAVNGAAAGGVSGGPWGAPPYGCVVQNVVDPWGSKSSAQVGNLPDGSYDVVVEVDDHSGNPLMGGSTTVQVAGGQVATANIGLGPVPVTQPPVAPQTPTGTGGVTVNFGNQSGTSTGAAGFGNRLVFANTPLTGAVNGCSAVSLAMLDVNGNPLTVQSTLPLSLAASSLTGAFYADSGCTQTEISTQIAAGGNGVTVFYRDPASGAPTLTVTDPSGSAGSASAAITLK